jgi:hypothetical protein
LLEKVVALYILVAVLLLGIEAFTLAFFAVFIAVGLLAAALAAAVGLPVWAQLATLSAVSVAGLALARPPLARAMMRGRKPMLTPGVQDLIGQTALPAMPCSPASAGWRSPRTGCRCPHRAPSPSPRCAAPPWWCVCVPPFPRGDRVRVPEESP